MARVFATVIGALVTCSLSEPTGYSTYASDLRVEYQRAPLGMSEPRPRFAFIPSCTCPQGKHKVCNCPRGAVQVAYRVVVTSMDTGAAMWDSGKVMSNRSSQIEYAGESLIAYTAYNWSAQWWAAGAEDSAASVGSSSFEMGPLDISDWKGASWLKGPRLRVNFTVPKPAVGVKLVRARAYIAAPGGHTLQVNGKASGDQIGISAWLRFDKSVLYQTHDITGLVSAGANTLELLIGKGFYGDTTVLARLVVSYSDGKSFHLSSSPGGSKPVLCGTAKEHESTQISCPNGNVIEAISFASFGTPSGDETCAPTTGANTFHKNVSCDAAGAAGVLKEACVGKSSCALAPTCNKGSCTMIKGAQGKSVPDPCKMTMKHLNVAVTCTRTPSPPPTSAWQQTVGLVQSDDPFQGTSIDWRLLNQKSTVWETAEAATSIPGGTMRAHSMPAAQVLRPVFPRNVTKLPNGHLVFEFPENFVGIVQFALASPPVDGSNITVKHGEVLLADGSVSFPWHEAWQTDVHVLAADMAAGTLVTPRFTWHGFQFAEVAASKDSGFDGKLGSVVGLVLGPDIAQTGTVAFSGSREASMLNSVQGLVVASQLSNLAGWIPTDCPTREKHGWLGDAQVTAEEALFNFDMAQIYTNYLQMIEDDQQPAGAKHPGDLLGVVPSKHKALESSSESASGMTDISWSAAYPLIARWVLRYYGDVRPAARHWKSMKIFVDQLTEYASSHCTQGLADYFTWGDWCPVESRKLATPGTGPELAAFNYILSLDAMAEMATILDADPSVDLPGLAADAARYTALAKKFRPIFHDRFFNASVNAYGARELELQSLTVAPLALGGVVPESKLPAVINSLSNDVKVNDNHFTVGSVGAKHLLPQLSAHKLHHQAMAIATQTTFPSFGYWLENGATTCWENYRGVADDSHPPPPTHNHIFLCGGVGEWMYRSVAGIKPAADGFNRFSFAPQMGIGPTSAVAQLKTVRGLATVGWSASPGKAPWALNATVPVSSTASITLEPLPNAATPDDVTVRESGTIVWENGVFKDGAVPGVLAGRAVGKSAVEFEIVSGSFSFEVVRGGDLFV